MALGGLALVVYFITTQEKAIRENPKYLHGRFEVRFAWEDGIKSMQIVNEKTGVEESDARVRNIILGEARNAVSRFVRYVGLKKAKGRIYVSVTGYEEPYLLRFEDAEITDPNIPQFMGAVQAGDASIVTKLLAEGVEVNVRESIGGRTALMWASDQPQMVKVLLAAGANPNVQDVSGQTALMVASDLGNIEVVKLLLEAGAEVNLKDESGEAALAFARRRGHKQIAELLRKQGAKE